MDDAMTPLPTISLADWKHAKLLAGTEKMLLDEFEEDWLWSRAHYEDLFPLHKAAGEWESMFDYWCGPED